MKLSKHTLNILKNFASINPSIYLRKGNIITTKSVNNVIYAEAKLDDVIDADIGIYDVSEFLSTLGLFNDDVEIAAQVADLQAEIRDHRSVVNYTLVDPSVIVYPAKAIDFPVADVQFQLRNEDFVQVLKASATLGLPEIIVTNAGGKIIIKAVDSKDSSANDYAIEVADYDGSNDFQFYISVENLRMVKGDYRVLISKLGAIKFEGTNTNYIVALEANSTFA